MEREYKLHTYDIQSTVIAQISESIRDKNHKVISAEDYDRLIDFYGDLNQLCTSENGYTLTLKIEA